MKCATTPGMMMVVPKGNHHTHTDDSTNKARKPISTAFGANVKTIGTSRAGFCILDQFLRSALECRDDFSKDNSNAA